MTSLFERIDGLRVDVKALINRVTTLSQNSELPPLPDAVDGIIAKLDQNIYLVPVMGEAKRGKSSFLNALMGRSILPVSDKIATNQVFRIARAEKFACRLRYEDGSADPIAVEDLATYGSQIYANSPRARAAAQGKLLRWIEIDIPDTVAKFLPKNIALLDTPGLGSILAAHGKITRRFIPYGDGVIYVLDSERPMVEDDTQYINEILDNTPNIFFIQTRIDQFGSAYKGVLARNREILREKFAERLSDPQVWPISNTNLMKAVETGDADYLQVSRFPALAEALQIFLFRSAGVEKLAQATGLLAEQLRQGGDTLNTRLKNLIAESQEGRAEIQRKIAENLRVFHDTWGERGRERERLTKDLQQIIQRGKHQFVQTLQPTGRIAAMIGREIDQIDSVATAKSFAESLKTNILEWADVEWNKVDEATRTACAARLAHLIADVGDLSTGVSGADGASISRTTTLSARGDLWTRVVGGRVHMVQTTMTAGLASALAGVAITTSWFPPVSLSIVAGLAVWGFLRGWRDTGARELEKAKAELKQHLAAGLDEVRSHFMSVSVEQSSVLDRHFSEQEAVVLKRVDGLINDKSKQVKVEQERLEADGKLGEAARAAKLAALRTQIDDWTALTTDATAFQGAFNAVIQELMPKEAAV